MSQDKMFLVRKRYKECLKEMSRLKKYPHTKAQLAEYLDVSERVIGYWIQQDDQHPISKSNLERMAAAFEVNPDWLIGESEDKTILQRVMHTFKKASHSLEEINDFMKSIGYEVGLSSGEKSWIIIEKETDKCLFLTVDQYEMLLKKAQAAAKNVIDAAFILNAQNIESRNS